MNLTLRKMRDASLRWAILDKLQAAQASPMSGLGGPSLRLYVDDFQPRDERFENEEHMLSLIPYLVMQNYVEQIDERTTLDQRHCLAAFFFRILPKGVQLLAREIPVDPLIKDDRIRKS